MITARRDLPGAAGDEASVAQEFVISGRFTSALALRRNGRVRDVLIGCFPWDSAFSPQP